MAASGNYVTLDLVPMRGSKQGTRTLMLSQRGVASRLAISNLPAENVSASASSHSMSEDEMAALHISVLYYELLQKQMPSERPLPMLVAPVELRATGTMGPFICPPAQFSRN